MCEVCIIIQQWSTQKSAHLSFQQYPFVTILMSLLVRLLIKEESLMKELCYGCPKPFLHNLYNCQFPLFYRSQDNECLTISGGRQDLKLEYIFISTTSRHTNFIFSPLTWLFCNILLLLILLRITVLRSRYKLYYKTLLTMSLVYCLDTISLVK